MRHAYLNLILFSLLAIGATAQNWQAQYGDSADGSHVFKVCRQTSDGGFIFGGRQINGNGTDDFYVVRTDINGNQLWDDSFFYPDYQDCRDVIQTLDGGFLISGISQSGGGPVVKYDASGNFDWAFPFPAIGSGDPYSLLELADGSFVVWGSALNSGSSNDGYLAKYDADGNQIWDRFHGSPNSDQGRGIVQTNDGGFVLSGYKSTANWTEQELWLLKVNDQGFEDWSTTFAWTDAGTPTSISVLATDNGYLICGIPGENSLPILYGTDSVGNELWSSQIGEPGDVFLRNSIIHDHEFGYLMAATSSRFGNGSEDVVLVRIDENGNDHLYHPFGGAEDDFGKSVRTTTDGGYIIAGYSSSFNPDPDLIEAYAIKIGPGDLPCYVDSLFPIICDGDVFEVGTNVYSQTGVYYDTLSTYFGCDSVIITDLTVSFDLTEQYPVICDGDSFYVGTNTYTLPGTYTADYTNVLGCDSTIVTHLSFAEDTFHFYPTICNGEFFTVSSATYTETGDYIAYFTSGMGCDSTVITHLTVLDSIVTEIDADICEGEMYGWGTYPDPGNFTLDHYLQSSLGCDSTVRVNLTVHPTYDTTISATICDGETFSVGTYTHTQTGTFVDHFYATGVCDSLVTVNLTVLPNPDTTLYASICEGDVFSVGSSTYTEAGVYVDSLESSGFCDSIITTVITWDLPTDYQGNPMISLVGHVFGDVDGACVLDTLDVPLPNWIVQADDGTNPLYGTTDQYGQFLFQVPFGTYDVSSQVPANWVNCGPTSQTVVVDSSSGCFETVDFPLVPDFDCAIMDLDLITVCLVPCSTSTYYLTYTNIGTHTAYAPTLTFIAGQHITVNSSSIPWTTPQSGQFYSFDLDSVPVGSSGTITIDVTVDCDADLLGYSVCSGAWHDPTQNCSTYAQYNGAEIEVEGECLNGDSIEFRILNTGGSDMGGSLDYEILQDDIVYLNGNFQLNSTETETITLPSTGHTYRIEAEQVPLHPFATDPVAIVVEGCSDGLQGLVSLGFADILENGDPIPSFDLDCSVITPECSSNVLYGSPVGIGPEKFISPDQELEYVITFEKEGPGQMPDPVFIGDELSPFLDPMSVVGPEASHDFNFRVTEDGVVNFTLFNVEFKQNPDSNIGFVKFTIKLKEGVQIGTQIRNEAMISYGPFSGGVQTTNETVHTVGERGVDFLIPLSVDDLQNSIHSLSVFPNPFSTTTTIELQGFTGDQIQIEVMNTSGQIVQRRTANNQVIQISRDGLPDGVYLYRVVADQEMIGAGQLVVGE